jgi:hypothetical protein
MAQKYISQLDSYNFMYPNNTQPEYDVKIIHDLIEGQPTGTITGIQPAITQVGNNLVFNTSYTWNLNNSEPFIDNNGKLNLINVYLQTPDKTYMAPWINVYILQTNLTGTTTTGGTMNFTVTPQMVGQTTFSSGNYSINFQFISRRTTNINGYYQYLSITGNTTPTPTPTPTITPTQTPGLTPTPTPTPRSQYTAIGSAPKVGATSCAIIGNTPPIYLDNTDFSIFLNNGGCLSDGVNTVSVIRNSDGTPISGTFYFVWYGGACSTTTFKSTNGNISVNPTQC